MSGRRGLAGFAAATVVAALALSACGASTPDLFVLTRSGSLPGAKLTLLVDDSGAVRCNGGKQRQLSDKQLLAARGIVDDLDDDAKDHRDLPARKGSLLRYHLRMEDGSVTFSDTDADGSKRLGEVVAFSREVAQQVCGLAR